MELSGRNNLGGNCLAGIVLDGTLGWNCLGWKCHGTGQMGGHWLVGNFFISCSSEPLSIDIEGLYSLLLGTQLFI